MAQEQHNSEEMEQLRQRAEIRLREQLIEQDSLDELTPEQVRQLVYELQTHQIELEMQNEMLRETQETLAATRNSFIELYDYAPVAYFTLAKEGMIIGANLTAAELLQAERSPILGRPFSNFVLAEDQDLYYHHRQKTLETAERHVCELRIKKADDSTFYGRLESRQVKGDTSFRLILSDISASKEMEKKLIHNERLQAVGELAAGVSHNLNNMLMGVLLPAQILRTKIDSTDHTLLLNDIITSGKRMAELVGQIHNAVHHNEITRLEPLDFNDIIINSIKLSRTRWQDEAQNKGIVIEVVTDLVETQPIRGTKSELESILLNLLFNAIDALPLGGTITVQTRPGENSAELKVSDTGIGMDNETLRRVFEPFFTSKKTVGTGLGLSTVYGSVQRWGGTISVESSVGQGTTFSLNLPTYREVISTAEDQESVIQPTTPPGRLLIADDDELIAHILGRLLDGNNDIDFAHSGTEALEKFEKDHYDAVIIDLGLPRLSGEKVAQAIRQIDPAVALVLITGWTLEADDERLSCFDFYTQKPITDLNKFVNSIGQAIALSHKRQQHW